MYNTKVQANEIIGFLYYLRGFCPRGFMSYDCVDPTLLVGHPDNSRWLAL